jgi:hypothetical protein
VSIVAFEIERVGDDLQTFVAVRNFAERPQTVELTVSRSDSVLFHRQLNMEAGATHRETVVSRLSGEPRFRAFVRAGMNALELDDVAEAYAWDLVPLTVGVIAPEGPTLALATADRSLTVTHVRPEQYSETHPDVWVFDGWLPREPPQAPSLIVDPPRASWLGVASPAGSASSWLVRDTHPVLIGVDSSLVRISSLTALTAPSLKPIALTNSGAAIVSIEDGASRRVVLHFAVPASNLPLTPAFPVLIGNAIDWLGRRDRGHVQVPGAVVLPRETVRVLDPAGKAIPLVSLGDRRAATLEAPGLYLAETTGATPRVLNVRLDDMRKANLLVSSVGPDTEVRPLAPPPPTSWWRLASLLAVLVLVVEWVTWDRRITV